MLATLLIVFREVLEASLIVSIVAAATRGVAHRGLWISTGIGAGLFGAVIVALFASAISNSLEGVGQEVFNACVMFAAVLMLGWHNVWMASHGRELAASMNKVGAAVASGDEPLYAVAVVVGLAVLREGSEVVLFLYGIASGGVGMSGLLAGGLLGVVTGAGVGFALYAGLLRLSPKYLFSVTGWLILLLAAGLAAQGANFLVQADMLPAFGGPIWDSSSLLAQDSLIGRLLHILVGYMDRPSGIEIIFYAATIIIMGGAMKLFGAPSKPAAKA